MAWIRGKVNENWEWNQKNTILLICIGAKLKFAPPVYAYYLPELGQQQARTLQWTNDRVTLIEDAGGPTSYTLSVAPEK